MPRQDKYVKREELKDALDDFRDTSSYVASWINNIPCIGLVYSSSLNPCNRGVIDPCDSRTFSSLKHGAYEIGRELCSAETADEKFKKCLHDRHCKPKAIKRHRRSLKPCRFSENHRFASPIS